MAGGFSRDVFPSIIWSWTSPTNNRAFIFQPPDHSSSISNQLSRYQSLWIKRDSEEHRFFNVAKVTLETLHATDYNVLLPTTTTSQISNMAASTSHVSKHSVKSLLIEIGINCRMRNILKEIILQNVVNGSGGCFFPGDSYPNWLTFYSECSSVTFKVPRVEGSNLKTMMCIVYTSTPGNIISSGLKGVLVKNYTATTILLYMCKTLVSFEDDEGHRLVSTIEPGDKVEVIFVFENDFIVKKTAIYLVYDAQDLNVIGCRGDENECSLKSFSTEDNPTDDFNQNRKMKNQVE